MTHLLRSSRRAAIAIGSAIVVSAAFSFGLPRAIRAQDSSPAITPAVTPATTPATNAAISFRRPLRVSSLRLQNNREHVRTQYFFTFDFPAEAVEPLEKIVFEQIEGADYPRYRSDDRSYAFTGIDQLQQAPIDIDNNRDQRTVTVEFDPPIEPGNPVTVALRARNPREGIYVYRLTAFPVDAIEGQYAGVEQLTFRRPIRRDRFWR